MSKLVTSPLFTIKKAHGSYLQFQAAQNLAYLCKVNKDSTQSCFLVVEFWVFILTPIDVELVLLNARLNGLTFSYYTWSSSVGNGVEISKPKQCSSYLAIS